ncbi:unannotated protein [freshwater metagenome]|uniref:Unannotated protein n=1 Tax=freshwater metagenome TaxID=449393 RepID=A0A6J7K4F3_9ZZZZ
MPSTSAIESEMKSSLVVVLFPYWPMGERILLPSGLLSTAAPRTSEKLKPYLPSTHADMRTAPAISRPNLMICTQVVALMPPISTYTTMRRPTTAIVIDCPRPSC